MGSVGQLCDDSQRYAIFIDIHLVVLCMRVFTYMNVFLSKPILENVVEVILSAHGSNKESVNSRETKYTFITVVNGCDYLSI